MQLLPQFVEANELFVVIFRLVCASISRSTDKGRILPINVSIELEFLQRQCDELSHKFQRWCTEGGQAHVLVLPLRLLVQTQHEMQAWQDLLSRLVVFICQERECWLKKDEQFSMRGVACISLGAGGILSDLAELCTQGIYKTRQMLSQLSLCFALSTC